MSFLAELQRRNVFKVGIAYAVACWLILQIVDLVLDSINAPDWVMQVFMLALAVGFPIAIIIAWAFEVTPEGVKLEKNVDRSKSITRYTGRQLNRGIIMILSVAIVFLLTQRFRDDISFRSPEKSTPQRTGSPPYQSDEKSVAVLPFINMSDEKENEYFSDGISEELLNSHPTTNVEAYTKYLLGRHLWNQRSPESMLAAIKPLSDAVAMDPDFGQAWAALADAYVLLPEYNLGSINESIPLARDAISKSLTIDPESTRALTTSAYIKFMFDFDLIGAHEDFAKAIELDPTYATARQWHGELLAAEGKLDAALDELRVARQLDPLSPIIPHVMAWSLMYTDRKEEAYQYYQEALDIDPYFGRTIGNLMHLNLLTGRFDQARQRCLELASIIEYDPTTDLAMIAAVENPEMKKAAFTQLMQDTAYPDGVTGRAFNLMLLKEYELALDYLERAFAEGDAYAIQMNRMNVYDPVRDNPRFQALVARMNLSP